MNRPEQLGAMTGTDVVVPVSGRSDVDAAVQVSDAAAMAAGVTVREVVDLDGMEQVVQLLAGLWGRDANPPVSLELLRAFTKAGNYVTAAYDDGRVVGACVGFFHAPSEEALHSHIAGVASGMAGRHVGFALKLHQRAWALLRGVPEIVWTFDPLVSRNAYFNLAKLGARPIEYLPNFYGEMVDAINGIGDSDRLLVRWSLTDPGVVSAVGGEFHRIDVSTELAAGASVALGISAEGLPVPGHASGDVALIAVPRDIEEVRRRDPGLARSWRSAVRDSLSVLVAEGAEVCGFDKAGWYAVRLTTGSTP